VHPSANGLGDGRPCGTLVPRLLKHKGFSWDADGEALLRELKPSYFDGTLYPRTVVLSEPLSNALQDARH
jgi:hypothetical protein